MLTLIPAPVKITPAGRAIPIPADWHYPRSEAYETAAAKRLSHGWMLYSTHEAKEIAAGRRTVGAEHVGRDWGAFRLGQGDTAIASVQGVRKDDGSPAYLRAWVRSINGMPSREERFLAEEIGQAAYWCDSTLGESVKVAVVSHATHTRTIVQLAEIARGLRVEDFERVRTEVLRGTVVAADRYGMRVDFELAE